MSDEERNDKISELNTLKLNTSLNNSRKGGIFVSQLTNIKKVSTSADRNDSQKIKP